MTGWVKWLGECVWRLLQLMPWVEPHKLDDEDKNFRYRTYGVAVLAVSIALGLWLVSKTPEPFVRLTASVTSYTGDDKPLAQAFTGALVALMIGLPIVLLSIGIVVFLITAGVFLWLLVTKGVGMFLGLLGMWYMKRRGAEESTIVGAAAGAVLGAVVGSVLAKKSNAEPPASANPPPAT